jgi:hypothetical protein
MTAQYQTFDTLPETLSCNHNNTTNKTITRMTSNNDITAYKFRLEAIFDNQEARQSFHDYLKDGQNEEALLFYTQVEQYTKLRLDTNRAQKAKEIVTQFIAPNSIHELNLSSSLRAQVLERFRAIEEKNNESSEEVVCPIDLFQQIQDICFVELRDDSFPRYIRSDNFQKLVAKQMKIDMAYLQKIGTRKSLIKSTTNRNSFVSVDDHDLMVFGDPSAPYITEDDILLALKLGSSDVDDKVWNTMEDALDYQTYLSRDFVQLGSDTKSIVKMVRIDGIFPFEPAAMMNTSMDSQFRSTVDKTIREQKFIEYITRYNNQEIPYATTIMYERRKFPLSVSREYVTAMTTVPMKYNRETKEFEQFVFMLKTVENANCPPPKGVQTLTRVRAPMVMIYIMEKKAQNFSKGTTIYAFDPKGFISSNALVKSGAKRHKQQLNGYTQAFKVMQKNNTLGKIPVNSNGMVEAIRHYISKRKEEYGDCIQY